ncbi:hypothetical protein A1D23_11185 [Chelonobacter oris]|uniref:MliC family protein n=1 Tax=Chelonobacter oris TaxID=505317 RepID=UPI002447748C|nr:MliC family protein [Chelonobacter oris]MDH3001015.1 hypothetical protein [Chelonobacter oris]
MIKALLLGGAIALLSACQNIDHSPASLQPTRQNTSGSAISTQTLPSEDATRYYHCDNDVEIKVIVLNSLAIKQHSKNPSIQLTLNNIKQHLQPVVSDSGKRYANIQWNWWEKNQSAVLSNSLGEVIVSGCVPKVQ